MDGVKISEIPGALVEKKELLDCPFCGCEAKYDELDRPFYAISCSNNFCKCTQSAYHQKEEAIEKWNNRQQGQVRLSLSREKLAKNIFCTRYRFSIKKEDVDLIFNSHFTTWNPSVNECWVEADALIEKQKDLFVVVK